MNTVSLIGNVASDFYVNEYQDKKGETQYVVNGSIIVNEPQGANREDVTTRVNITAFRGRATTLKDLTVKGSQIGITGRLREDSYEKDGKTVYKTYVLVEDVKLLDTKEQTEAKRDKLKDNPSNE
ncbi:single-stranded DNA-binding protein [Staphylococcus shinii]|uniref:single-stranded DNA-binding protein n=1 Tax=Staphylococcus shinii TaxID=2912228 RepID=UPI003CE7FFBF